MTDQEPDAGSGSGEIVERAVQQFRDLIDAHRRRTRWLFAISLVKMALGLVGIVCGVALAYAGACLELSLIVGISGAFVALLGLILLFVSQSSMEQDRNYLEELRIEGLDYDQQQFERARLKIQYYMHENLRQVHSIYGLTTIAMIFGFVTILAGVGLAYLSAQQDDASVLPSVVATLSGVVVQFIGKSFLSVYRSTKEQAKEYVSILERINKVGMFKFLIRDIPDNIKGQSFTEIARTLLLLYDSKPEAKNDAQSSS